RGGAVAGRMRAGVRVVSVSNSLRVPRLPVVTQDEVGVGRLAAGHLRDCGCRSFGFWGQAGASYAEQRWAGFREALAEAGVAAARGGSRAGEAPARAWGRMRRRPERRGRAGGGRGAPDRSAR